MKQTTIQALKSGEFFTLRPYENPTEKQVYVRDAYNRTTKRYSACRFDDINEYREYKGDKVVYVGFTF